MNRFATQQSDRSRRTRRLRARRARRGFTLIETALATVIVGTGVLAIMAAQQAFHQQNNWSTHASIAERLGNEIRELSLNLPRHDPVTDTSFWGLEPNETAWVGDYDDLDDFDGTGAGVVFSAADGNGPINARREIISNMDGWTQTVTVHSVDPFDINLDPTDATAPADGTTTMLMVEVVVTFEGDEMTRVSWIAPN